MNKKYDSYKSFVIRTSGNDQFYTRIKDMMISSIAKDLKIDQSGFRFITNNGNDAHQTVKHFHVHLLAGKKLGPLINN